MKGCKEVALAKMSFPKAPLVLLDGEKADRKSVGSAFACYSYSPERRIVCVTSANSCLGAHLAKKLLARGYLVRVTIQNPGKPKIPNDIQLEQSQKMDLSTAL